MVKEFMDFFNKFFYVYMIIYAILFFLIVFIATMSISEYKKKRKYMRNIAFTKRENYIPISILVPAYNEEVTIIDSIKSLIQLDYPTYEIVVINDGSKDNTSEKVIREFDLKRVEFPAREVIDCEELVSTYENTVQGIKITLVNKKNGGKADSLNAGINVCKYPLFISLDADSILRKDALLKIVEPFIEDDKTVAVGGSIKVSNSQKISNGEILSERIPKKLIILFQAVEYIRVFTTTRVAFDKYNANLIVSGAFGLFNKRKVISVGGYSKNSIGEDMDLIVRLHKYCMLNELKYKIAYVLDAVCLSQVPETYSDLRRQRTRWNTGMLQSLTSNKDLFVTMKRPALGYLGIAYYVLFEVLSPVIEIVGFIVLVTGCLMGILSLGTIIACMTLFIVYNIMVSWVAIALNDYVNENNSSKMKFALYMGSVLESFGFRQINLIYRLESLMKFKSKNHKWGEIKRRKMD